jgi:metal-responsive CopG/Arc/MetJ family transcriptional regulator
MAQPSLVIEDEVLERIDSRLSYGDSRSEWFRHAAKMRLQVDPTLDELFEPEDTEKRMKFIEAAVQKEVDRVKENPNYDGPDGGLPGE